MHYISAEIRVEVAGISKYFEEAAYSLLGFVLSLFLKVYWLMGFVKMCENAVNEF